MEKFMESHGILKSSKSMNPALKVLSPEKPAELVSEPA